MPDFQPRLSLLACATTALLLSACGGGGSSSGDSLFEEPGATQPQPQPDPNARFNISGQVRVALSNFVDSDINDIRAPFTSNNLPTEPQQLSSNLLILQGYVTRSSNNGDPAEARFSNSQDENDYFRVRLQQGQRVQVQAAAVDGGSLIATSLIELNDDGSVKTNGQSDTVISTTGGSELVTDSSSDYLINVRALTAASRYTLTLLGASTSATASRHHDFVAGELLVKYKTTPANTSSGTASLSQVAAADYPVLVSLSSATTVKSLASGPSDPLESFSPATYARLETLKKVAEMRQQADVEYAQPNYIYRSQRLPNDRSYDFQWSLPQIRMPQAWDLTTGARRGGGDVIIAVLDSGILPNHPDFAAKLVDGYDFVESSISGDGDGPDSDPTDPGNPSIPNYSFHGSHVAGIAAAASNNNIGIAGVSWDAQIMPIRVLGNTGEGTSSSLIQGVRYAAGLSNSSGRIASQIADVINLSLGSEASAPAEQALFEEVHRLGISVVAASGNSSTATPFYPAAYPTVISVSATNQIDGLAHYSNFGSTISLAAPGGTDRRDDNNDGIADLILSLGATQGSPLQYRLNPLLGTSMAAPHVAGVLALMKAVHPDITAGQINTLMQNGLLSDDIGTQGKDNLFGYGRINALKAVTQAERLANGGTLPDLPVLLDSNPPSLVVGSSDSAVFSVQNLGGETPTISATADAPWLTVSFISDASATLSGSAIAQLQARINRDGLSSGLYQGNIRISTNGSNPVTLDVPVFMQVGSSSSSGALSQQYVSLIPDGAKDPSVTVIADSEGRFVFRDIPVGDYQILAGSDIDVNNFLCEVGETCGLLLQPGSPLLRVENSDISGVNFGVSIITQSLTENRVQALNLDK